MSRKDYIAIAKILKAYHDRALTHREHTLICAIAVDFARHMGDDSSSFDRSVFLKATGSTEYV